MPMLAPTVKLPSEAELTVPQDLDVSTVTLKVAGPHMHSYCENQCKEFMLCRKEEEDPRKCLREGKDVTACGVRFLQQVKKHCRKEFDQLVNCVDRDHSIRSYECRPWQRPFDTCMLDKLALERPYQGAMSRPHVHVTDRPKPPTKERNFEAEAGKVIQELPMDYPMNDRYLRFYDAEYDFLS